uniref:Thermonuclease/nuclease n=1 Tax=Marseillevirus LCMAC102 TaxID=2506603 RepID=A0A481YUC4_9VIRU|nr:MAG: thermonuclease/nuclease [Marseillevirus LCMAC102]
MKKFWSLFRRKKEGDNSIFDLATIDPICISDLPHKGKLIKAKITDVYDGDTCTVIFAFGTEFLKIKIRVLGVDTPEIKVRGVDKSNKKAVTLAKLEKEAGIIVRDDVRNQILNSIVSIKMIKWDKFGGRVDGEIFLQKGGTLTDFLLKHNLAKPYDGGKKEAWSKKELKTIINQNNPIK